MVNLQASPISRIYRDALVETSFRVSRSACGEHTSFSHLECVSSMRLLWTHNPSVSRSFPSQECFRLVLVDIAFLSRECCSADTVVNKHTSFFMSQEFQAGAWGECASFLVSRVLIKLALVVTHEGLPACFCGAQLLVSRVLIKQALVVNTQAFFFRDVASLRLW